MPKVVETIPDALAAEAEAARAWFSNERDSEFKVTGIVDPESIGEQASASGASELQLILCGSCDVARQASFSLHESWQEWMKSNGAPLGAPLLV